MEENISQKKFLNFKNIVFVILLLIFINLAYLDVIVLRSANVKTIEKIITAPIDSKVSGDDCDANCIDRKINTALSSVKISVTPLPTPTPLVIKNTSATNAEAAREYYVPFGSASYSSTSWQNVPGLSAYIDSTSYPNIKTAVFEVSLHIQDGSASVRLFNSTDGHPVWNSQIDFDGNTLSILKTSSPVTLDSGNKLYQVQVLTQLNSPAVIDQSRLHITTK